MSSRHQRQVAQLPDELLQDEIFVRLPLWAQRDASAVCKRWRRLLSSVTRRALEQYVVVFDTVAGRLRLYNVPQGRWMKPLEITSLGTPLKDHFVFLASAGELFLFRDGSSPTRLAIWNAATGESRALSETDPLPGDADEMFQYGCYVNKSGELQLLVFNDFGHFSDRGPVGDLYVWKGGEWRPSFMDVDYRDADFSSGEVVVFKDYYAALSVHLFDVEQGIHTPLEPEPRHGGVDDPLCSFAGRYYFPKHGTYAMSVDADDIIFGVSRFDVKQRRWESVGEAPEEVKDDALPDVLSSCTDGEENIWISFSPPLVMYRFNVVSRVWTRFSRDEEDEEDRATRMCVATF